MRAQDPPGIDSRGAIFGGVWGSQKMHVHTGWLAWYVCKCSNGGAQQMGSGFLSKRDKASHSWFSRVSNLLSHLWTPASRVTNFIILSTIFESSPWYQVMNICTDSLLKSLHHDLICLSGEVVTKQFYMCVTWPDICESLTHCGPCQLPRGASGVSITLGSCC